MLSSLPKRMTVAAPIRLHEKELAGEAGTEIDFGAGTDGCMLRTRASPAAFGFRTNQLGLLEYVAR